MTLLSQVFTFNQVPVYAEAAHQYRI